jgi:hypothetical protein
MTNVVLDVIVYDDFLCNVNDYKDNIDDIICE